MENPGHAFVIAAMRPSSALSPSQQHCFFSIKPQISPVQKKITLKNPFPHNYGTQIKAQSLTCNSQWQHILEAIRASPTSEITRIIDQNGGFQTISDFNQVLLSLVLADEFELALKLSSSSSYALAPDEYTYSTWVTLYCKKDDLVTAKSVLAHMLEDGFQPKVSTFTTLINSFCKAGKLQQAYEVFQVMAQIGCEPTIDTYNCLLKGLCFVGRVEEAYDLFLKIKKPDLYTYTAVMDGFCKVGRTNEASELLEKAISEMGLTPNVVTYNTLFNGYFKEGRPLDGFRLLKRMKEENCVPDQITYRTLLHGLLKWGEIRDALFVYKEMIELDFEVDGRMMNSLLRGLCRRSRKEEELLKDAYQVFDKMRSWRLVVDPVGYELVIEAYCRGKQLDTALECLYEMVNSSIGYSPKAFTFSNFIRVLCLEGKVVEALLVSLLMLQHGKSPSRVPFNLLIDKLNQQGMVLNACYLYGLALKSGVVPRNKPIFARDEVEL